MPEIKIQNFGEQIEKEIQDFAKEVAEIKKSPEHGHLNEKEIVGRAVQAKIHGPAGTSGSQPAASNDDDLLPPYLKNAAPEIKTRVEELINFTFRHGIEKGISEAVENGPFILDAYHDALTAKLHEELVKRKII